jgi:hypothetical protein
VTDIDEQAIDQFFYRALTPSSRHRHQVSIYLVQRLNGSKVAARIVSLGLVHEKLGEQQVVLKGLHRNLVLSGRWHPTRSRRHARVRVVALR